MNILYIITQADGGGAQKYTLELASYFKGTIACGNEKTTLFEQAEKLGIKTFRLKYLKRSINPIYDIFAIWEIYSLIKNINPDIVHANSTKAGLLGSIAGKLAGKKVIFTAHGFRYNEPLSPFTVKFYLLIEKLASLFRSHTIAVSQADYNSAIANNVTKAKSISVVHNGIKPIDFLAKPEAQNFLKISTNKIIIGTLANFYKTKGLDVLIEAISMLSLEVQNRCQFVIIGDGGERGQLTAISSQLSVPVTFAGKIYDAARYLKAFDIFVLPSRKEGFPYAILEAMQAGLPIVASKVGGIPEALNGAGILVEPQNPKALAEALEKLINNPNLRTQLSQKSLERSKEFTLEKMLKETEEVYNKFS